MTRKKPPPKATTTSSAQPPTVSGSWLVKSLVLSVVGGVVCVWGVFCLLFWQGSWQLLFHPTASITRTPASVGLSYEQIGFAATESGELQLQGWLIPAAPSGPFSRYTVLYLHSQNGNLGDTVDALARLHETGVNILAFDYRGYGKSAFARPSEAHWREDAGWALRYLTGTRHVAPSAIVLYGTGLGANLALEVAAENPQLAGVILDAPLEDPMQPVFSDQRASLVPAHLLNRDRFDMDGVAADLRIPSLWIVPSPDQPEPYQRIASAKNLVHQNSSKALAGWLSRLSR
jgi:hypothetical protein